MTSNIKSALKKSAREKGFKVKGDFIIINLTNDVVSGFAIDATPSSIHIWTFILPIFDKISFLHMSLGERELYAAGITHNLDQLIAKHKRFLSIKTTLDLLSYLRELEQRTEFVIWAHFLCLIRLERFDEAGVFISRNAPSISSRAIVPSLEALLSIKNSHGWKSVLELLDLWAADNKVDLT